MKRLLLLLGYASLFTALATAAHADSAREVFQRANQAYLTGQYDAAIAQYQVLVESGVADPDITFNLGTAHARAGHYGEAIRWFERTLVLRPGDDDAERGIAGATSLLGTRRAQAEGEATVQTRPAMFESFVRGFSEDTLAIATLALDTLFFAVLVAFFFVGRESTRLALGIAAPLLGLLGIVAMFALAQKMGMFRDGRPAVIVREHAEVREGPDPRAAERAHASEGERAELISRQGNYVHVRLSGRREGFMLVADVGEI
ncbi:MAG: tetratricopeptide repeat protein [Sandaracinaceae bacterium]|jgi:tetratricopeptide (TPR) repeat protein|nr:tetratricopeptide repeat protein [Sandaracinaceae bacterium]